jgi:hypothetical protein
MKATLKISILANVGLTGMVLWLMHRGQNQTAGVPVAPTSINVPAAAVPQPVSSEMHPEPQKKFQWRQLESADYRAYIANLKAVGCPRQTIRDIITADVDSLYAARRQQLELQTQALDGHPLLKANAEQALGAKLQGLNNEESSVLAALLGSPPDPAQPAVADNTATPARTERDQSQDDAVSVPLVFQETNPAALNLTQDQLDDLAYLRQKFEEDVGGPSQDPRDPAYLRRWQAAQPQNDQMLRAMLGSRVYDQFENQAGNQAASAR